MGSSRKHGTKRRKNPTKKDAVRGDESHEAGALAVGDVGPVTETSFDLTTEQIEAAQASIQEWLDELPSTIREERQRLARVYEPHDGFDVVANVWYCTAPVGRGGRPSTSTETTSAVVEYTAHICLDRPSRAGTSARVPIGAEVLKPALEDTPKLLTLLGLHRMHDAAVKGAERPLDLGQVQGHIALQRLYIRNPGYDFQEERRLRALFTDASAGVDPQPAVGYSVDDALKLSDGVINLGLKRMRLKGAKAAAYSRNVLTQLDRQRRGRHVGRNYEQIVSQLEQLSVKAASAELQRRTLAWMVFQLGDYASFTAKDLASFCLVDEAAAEAFLMGGSVEFGSLPPWKPGWELETLRDRPFMRDAAGRYLLASLQSPLWTIRPQIETALKQAGGRAWHKYEKHRGEYLEDAAVEALRSILDPRLAYAGIQYEMESNGQRQRFELDGLLVRESALFLVETKAGALHPSAWRGGADRLERQLGQLIAEATDQASRAKRALVEGEALTVLDRRGRRLELDLSGVRRVFRVVVTLEDLSSVTTVLWQLQDAGIFSERDSLPWVVALNELELIAELVEYPAQFVHFILRRLRLNELKRVVASDELDWFMNYLRDGLFFENELAGERAPDRIFLDSYTDEVDAYIFAREGRTRDKPKKPRQRNSRKFDELLASMLRSGAPTDALLALLDMDGPAREMLASRIQTLRRRSARDGRFHDMTMTFDDPGYLGITAMTAPPDQSAGLGDRLELYCTAKKYQYHADRWLGLAAYEGPNDPVQAFFVDVEPWQEDPELEDVVKSLGLTMGRPGAGEAAG